MPRGVRGDELVTNPREASSPLVEAALIASWLAARLWVGVPGAPVEVEQTEGTAGDGFPPGRDAIHLVTAWNPDAQPLTKDENDHRQQLLVAELDAAAVEHWPAAGYAADLSWVEHGLALPAVSTRIACALGLRYGQLAIYRWRRETVETLHCATGAQLAASAWVVRPRPTPPPPPSPPTR